MKWNDGITSIIVWCLLPIRVSFVCDVTGSKSDWVRCDLLITRNEPETAALVFSFSLHRKVGFQNNEQFYVWIRVSSIESKFKPIQLQKCCLILNYLDRSLYKWLIFWMHSLFIKRIRKWLISAISTFHAHLGLIDWNCPSTTDKSVVCATGFSWTNCWFAS